MKKSFLLQLCKKLISIFCSLLIALFLAGIIIQHDPWLIEQVDKKVNALLARWYGGQFSAHVAHINLMQGSIQFNDVSAQDYQRAWQWHADKVVLSWSWRDFLYGRKCALSCMFSDLVCTSHAAWRDGKLVCAIEPHFLLMAAPPEIEVPFVFSALYITNGHFVLLGDENWSSHVDLSGSLTLLPTALRTSVTFQKGFVNKHNQEIVQRFEGRGELTFPFDKPGTVVTGDFSCVVPSAPDMVRTLAFHANYTTAQGWNCLLENNHKSVQATALISAQEPAHGAVTMVYGEQKIMLPWRYDVQQNMFIAEADVDAPAYGIEKGTMQLRANKEAFTVQAHAGNKTCSVQGTLFPPMVHTGTYQEDGKTLISCSGADATVQVNMVYDLLRIIARRYGVELQGDGLLQADMQITDQGIQAHGALKDAHIRIPLTYSILHGVTADVQADLGARTITLKNVQANLYKGSLSSSQVTVICDEQGGVKFLQFPLMVQKCFIGWKKDFFTQFSGALMARMVTDGNSSLEGEIFLDQAHIRGNVLSAEFQQEFFGGALQTLASSAPALVTDTHEDNFATMTTLDIAFSTKKPVEVKTPFLEAALHGVGRIEGTLAEPRVTGTLTFERGTLGFLYKPLFITMGKITLRPEAPDDPLLDIIARNQIKKSGAPAYDIELAITGSARQPKVYFSSSPHLEQAQIITLLLGGSDDGSLYFLMPQVVTDMLEHLLFGSAEVTSGVQKYLGMLFKPLKRVSIVPKLSDQSGHGGLRAALEIEVNDRLRAVLEKNLTFPEDTTFQVEYDLSDDAQMRVMQDERGDVGFEGEMRWKF